jgi:hypothetical protein
MFKIIGFTFLGLAGLVVLLLGLGQTYKLSDAGVTALPPASSEVVATLAVAQAEAVPDDIPLLPATAQDAPGATVPEQAKIHITSDPEGAQLFVDSVYQGLTPHTVEAPQGETLHYRVVSDEDVYKSYAGTLDVQEDQNISVWLDRLPRSNTAASVAQSPDQTAAVAPADIGIGVTYGQMMNYLSSFFVMELSPLADGRPRYFGTSSNNLAMLEIIGDRFNISATTLIIGLPNDAPTQVMENSAIMLRFLLNAMPEWPESSEWVTDAIHRLADSNVPIETTRGVKRIKVDVVREMGMLMVTVDRS